MKKSKNKHSNKSRGNMTPVRIFITNLLTGEVHQENIIFSEQPKNLIVDAMETTSAPIKDISIHLVTSKSLVFKPLVEHFFGRINVSKPSSN
jgi:hypothetical protein